MREEEPRVTLSLQGQTLLPEDLGSENAEPGAQPSTCGFEKSRCVLSGCKLQLPVGPHPRIPRTLSRGASSPLLKTETPMTFNT